MGIWEACKYQTTVGENRADYVKKSCLWIKIRFKEKCEWNREERSVIHNN